MNTHLYSRWKSGPPDSPAEFYSELDPARWEIRKVEVFADGRLGHASSTGSLHGTRLGLVPVPSFDEIASQPEFQTKVIQADEFEAIWKRATGR
jgi:hypothetical protein